ncbi:nanos homolog 1 [Gadus macrocephalus]|uniref:nanos homolog 1-like n=1 Tax=Gadus chalcogrammus TaxID=1042646 RepID=UPI0024C42322|nr:nanos homolog 1-like [Gadus chalcogrammus]XP_059907640.1 nanos homolog 1 [Gadus macrocephalus]
MDLLDHGLFGARSPYNYTFNFWNDYLGLSTIVAKNKLHPPSLSANSITESLKATLGLDDSPLCACVTGHGGGGDAQADSCCCRCCCSGAPSGSSPPPLSIFDLKERLSLLRPYGHLLSPGDAPPQAEEREATYRGSFGAMDLHMGLALDRRRNKQQPHVHSGSGGGGRSGKPEPKVCVFCRNNGAPEEVYGSHILKTADGRVLCPILRAYTCPLCSANGDHAHTIKYCPLSRDHPSQRAAKGARTVHHKRLAIF